MTFDHYIQDFDQIIISYTKISIKGMNSSKYTYTIKKISVYNVS